MLEDESTFDETTAECINSFLNRLPKPICLVAHNGWNFDYPILHYVYDEIEKVNYNIIKILPQISVFYSYISFTDVLFWNLLHRFFKSFS